MRTDPVTATVVRLGIVAPSRGRTARAVHLGVTLDAVLDEVFEAVPVPYRTPTWFRRAEGDATTLIIPPTVPHGWVARELVALLDGALRRRNRHLNEFGRLRLRMAADHGDVVLRPPYFGGAAVALATWLCAAEVLKAAIAAAPELDLLLIVSDRFHTALPGDPGFRRVVVPAGGEREIAWLGPGPDTGTRNTAGGGGLAPS
ncbi:hypothetical protein [Amycolatopsis solani]|uniref:hypothetical protein n=1 Tax=Amycolatopsis solani TaxID=3028615 RepID=UPI0025B01604|nr:hypothetical protein [Amycolatopsis sp. MEP2-6]